MSLNRTFATMALSNILVSDLGYHFKMTLDTILHLHVSTLTLDTIVVFRVILAAVVPFVVLHR